MKAITHARKAMILEYFEVLESELGRALNEDAAAGTATFIETVATRVQGRMVNVAAQMPEASAPSFQQIRKTLENVLDPDFSGDSHGDPIKAVRSLKQQLRGHPEYTAPKGGTWKRATRAHQRKAR